MKLVHVRDVSADASTPRHQGHSVRFRHLLRGEEGTRENFLLSLVYQRQFQSPRHKQNFDQFRYALKGDFCLEPGEIIKQGELVYQPEGVLYGPQHDEESDRVLLVLQFGGTSGQGYLSIKQQLEASKELSKSGHFKGGQFYRSGKEDVPQEALEAMWEVHHQRQLVYPLARYKKPVVMIPDNFAWQPVKSSDDSDQESDQGEGKTCGAYRKTLGAFSERETVAEMIKIESGGRGRIAAHNGTQLCFVVKGEGKVNGQRWEEQAAVKLLPHESAYLCTDTALEILHFILPTLH
ncbi:MAG: hypothetical protein LQ351_007522 [Letrouitia transgressa]|nr:MAG: hypothetical protein LQ351_007522 [Letrouitia transgressa]